MRTGGAARTITIALAALGLATAAVATETRVNLTPVNNIYGIGKLGTPVTLGGYDTGGGAYPGGLLGTSLSYNGASFTLSAPGPKSAVSDTVVPLPAGQFANLSWLGSAVNGAQLNQKFIVTYTDSTTSTFTQSIDDYGRLPENFAGETVVTTNPLPLPYKINNQGAKHAGTYRVFGFSFPLNRAKTVKSLTLPANRNVGVLAIDMIPGSDYTQVSLSSASTIFGISKPGLAVTGRGLDQNGGAYAGDELGTFVMFGGNTYKIPAPGANTAVSSKTITLPAGQFSILTLLGGAVEGAQTDQPFVVTYTDSSTTKYTQSLSDWGSPPQKYANESIAKTLTYKILADGTTHANTYRLYAYSFALDSSKTVKSVTLPNNRRVVVISADLLPPATSPSTPVSLSGSSKLFGISTPGLAVTGGGIDGLGSAYAGDQLGTSLTLSGQTFQFASPGPNSAASSTTLSLPSGNFTKLMLLGTAVNGAQSSQPFVVTYTDSTSTTFTQSLSNWGSTPQKYPNETVAKTLSYKIIANGTTHANTYTLYAYAFSLNSAKTVKTLKLPSNSQVVILAANVVGSALPTADSPTFSPLPGNFSSAPTITLADATAGASIYYTTNGTAPTISSTKYTSPFKISATTTVEAIAVAGGHNNSAVVLGAYTVDTLTSTATPTFSPAGGSFSTSQSVKLSDTTAGASIYFTSNGTMPTAASSKYSSTIAVTSNMTIKAIGIASGHTSSAVASATYTIGGATGSPPSGLSYTDSPPLLIGRSVSLTPKVTGTVTAYSVTPTLPKGLSINAGSGIISGTPTTVTASATYAITAANSKGSTTDHLALQVDSGPRVHLTATATTSAGAPLTYIWKVTDGVLTNTNGAQADWELPPGFGLHFAYVLVADNKGGYVEGRLVVSTDVIGAPQVIPIKALPPAVSSPYQKPHARVENASASLGGLRGNTVRPALAPGTMFNTGNILLGDNHLPGIDDPFFGLQVVASVTQTSQQCIADFGCPPAVTTGQFGDFSILNEDPGAAENPQTLTATIQNASGTRNFIFEQWDLDAMRAQLPTFLIPGTATPIIHAMYATFNGSSVGSFQLVWPDAGGDPAAGYPQQNWFLSYLGNDDARSACAYYEAVGAATGCDSTGKASGAVKFTDWQKQVGIDNFANDGIKTVTATYVNVVDLNLTRSHHSIRHDDGDMGAYVCNHSGPVDSSGKSITVNLPANTMTSAQQSAVNTAVSNGINGKNLVACVAMDYISTPINGFAQFTRFLVFGPSGELLPSVNLDGRGEKFVPGACVACHGADNGSGKFGVLSTAPDIGAHFLPYDAGNFAFSTASGFTEAAQETAIYTLNQNILHTNPTASVNNLITNWYKAGQVLDKSYVPTAWAEFPAVYQQVVARSCRTCHAALSSYDWDALGPDGFASYVSNVCDTPNSVTGNTIGTQNMPQSKVTFDRLWSSAGTSEDQPAQLEALYHAKGTLASGSACVLRQPPH